MLSILFLCCHRVPACEQLIPSPKKPGHASSHHGPRRMDHASGPDRIETGPSLILADTEPNISSLRTARRPGVYLGMGTGRGRHHDDTGNSPDSVPDSTQRTLPRTCTSSLHHYNVQDDEQSIVFDPSAFYLAPLISVSSIGTEVQATLPLEAPKVHETDLIQPPGLVGTEPPCLVSEELFCTDGAAADDPVVHKPSPAECEVESIATTTPEIIITPSKPEPITPDEDPWSPFGIWLLAQTLDTHSSPSLGTGADATLNADTNPVSRFHHRMHLLEGEFSTLEPAQVTVGIPNAEIQIPNRHHSTCTARSVRQRPRRYPTEGIKYPPGVVKSCRSKDSSYLTVPETSFGSGRLDRRSAHMSLSSCKSLPYVSDSVRLTVTKGMMKNEAHTRRTTETRTEARTRQPWVPCRHREGACQIHHATTMYGRRP